MAALLLVVTTIPAAPQSDLAVSVRSASVFHWPWEVRRYRAKGQKHQSGRDRQASPPVDCEQVRRDVETLSADRYERAMRFSSKRQRRTIAKCMEGGS